MAFLVFKTQFSVSQNASHSSRSGLLSWAGSLSFLRAAVRARDTGSICHTEDCIVVASVFNTTVDDVNPHYPY